MLPHRQMWNSTLGLALVACAGFCWAQGPESQSGVAAQAPPTSDVQQQLEQVTARLISIQDQLRESQTELQAMRAELARLREQVATGQQQAGASQSVDSLRAAVEQLQESSSVVQAEVRQHDQTKVESESKYPLRVSGMALFTSALNSGNSDDADVPVVALPRGAGGPAGSLTGTARQSLLGLEGTGPHLWGAKSSASVNLDFFGGFPWADYWTAAGSVRLRTAQARLDWENRSLAVAFAPPILSPREPTSWLSVGEPALAWSGYLWTWSPQLTFRQDDLLPGRHLTAELGLIDAVAPGAGASSAVRVPGPAEKSRQPGYEAHVGPRWAWGDRSLAFGAGGYYSRQSYSYHRHLDAWGASGDWEFSPVHFLSFSGQVYRGRGIGGLGGGAFKDYVSYYGYKSLRGLDAEGGWAQMKVTLSPTMEANIAGGEDSAFGHEVRGSDYESEQTAYSSLARNQNVYANFVYRPKSYLVFSTEYRQLRSWPVTGERNQNRILGWAAGYLF